MEKGFIYGLRCPISGEIRYIGQTIKTLSYRLSKHISKTKTKINKKQKLSHNENWLKKLIELNVIHLISIEEIEIINIKDLDDREIFWISKFRETNNLTNLTDGGNQPKGYHWFHSEEGKKNISKGLKNSEKFYNSVRSDERTIKIKEARKKSNYKVSDITINKRAETIKRLGLDINGEKNPFFGKKHSDETKKIISEKNKERVGEKNPFYGKKHSDETKEKIAKTLKGKPKKIYYIYDINDIFIKFDTSLNLLSFFKINKPNDISRFCDKNKLYKGYYIKSKLNSI